VNLIPHIRIENGVRITAYPSDLAERCETQGYPTSAIMSLKESGSTSTEIRREPKLLIQPRCQKKTTKPLGCA
jgi:hypothetical protein